MTTYYKRSIKNLNDSIKALKAADKAECNSFTIDDKWKNIANANWDVLYAARELMRQALINVSVYEGCTEEVEESIMSKLNSLFD